MMLVAFRRLVLQYIYIYTRKNWGEHKVSYHAVYDFNNLESDCQNAQSIPQFKLKVFCCRP